MKKKYISLVFCGYLIIFILGLSACSTSETTFDAKYVSIYDESSYLVFGKDGSLKNSLWTRISGDNEEILNCFMYTIDENGIITAIDTTKYEGQDSLNEYKIGIMYKDYICVSWEGKLPIETTDTTISCLLGDLALQYHFKDVETYEYIVISNKETVYIENGTYSINSNEVVCTNEEGLITTFVSIEDNTYCIEYVKE